MKAESCIRAACTHAAGLGILVPRQCMQDQLDNSRSVSADDERAQEQDR